MFNVLVGEIFLQVFSIFEFISRYGGVLSQFANFNSPGKWRTV